MTVSACAEIVGAGEQVSGISAAGYVANFARPTKDSPTLSNEIFQTLLDNEWEPVLEGDAIKVDPIEGYYKSVEGDIQIPVATWVLLRDPELRFYVSEYANNMESLREAFANVWVYMMNADRFDGPTGNVCMDMMTVGTSDSDGKDDSKDDSKAPM